VQHNYGIDLAQSWFIGDILNDVEAGCRAGCRTILIDNGNETGEVSAQYRTTLLLCPGSASDYKRGARKYRV